MEKRYGHTLIIGGTGMLRSASITLAERSGTLTSVARTNQSLGSLDSVVHEATSHYPIALDWSDPHAFLDSLMGHLTCHPPPELVLAWLHSDELTIALAQRLGDIHCEFYHVISSASRNPLAVADEQPSSVLSRCRLDYRQIILGHVQHRHVRRWLTNAEISAGTLTAIESELPRHIVGKVDTPDK